MGSEYGVWKEQCNIFLNRKYTLDITQWLSLMDEYNFGVWLLESQ